MISLKNGVRLQDLRPQVVLAIQITASVYARFGLDMTVTSVNDSSHSPASLHHSGSAFDVRTHNAPNPQEIRDLIRGALPPEEFDVIYEGAGTENAHIHIEYQPKR